MAILWLIPPGLLYDAALFIMQGGAFEFGVNEARMDGPYGNYKETWVKNFVLNSRQKAGIVVLFVFFVPILIKMILIRSTNKILDLPWTQIMRR